MGPYPTKETERPEWDQMQSTDCDGTEGGDFQLITPWQHTVQYILYPGEGQSLTVAKQKQACQAERQRQSTSETCMMRICQYSAPLHHHTIIKHKELFSSYTLKLRNSCSSTLRHRKQEINEDTILTYQWFKECYHILYIMNEYVDMIYNILRIFLFVFLYGNILTQRFIYPLNPLNRCLQTGIKQRSTFWDITHWEPNDVLEEHLRRHVSIFRIEEEVKQNTKKERVRLCLLPSPCWFRAWLTPQLLVQYVPLKYRLALYGLHSAALLKTGLIIATAESLSSYTSIKQNFYFCVPTVTSY